MFSAPVRSIGMNVSEGDQVNVGDVINCSADVVYPPVSYYWEQYVNEAWGNITDDDNNGSDGSILRLSTAGIKLLRCGVFTMIGNRKFIAESVNITLYVVAKPGKCFQIGVLSLQLNSTNYTLHMPSLKPCPHCRRKVRLSPLSRRFLRQSHFSATVWTGLNVISMISPFCLAK